MIKNKLADPDHGLWKFLRLVVLLIAILIVFELSYMHGLGRVDFWPIVELIGVVCGFDQLKSRVTIRKTAP